jgi:outer membrane protein assembly factor BamA
VIVRLPRPIVAGELGWARWLGAGAPLRDEVKQSSTESPQADLRQAFHIQRGDIADAEEIGVGIANLRALFQRKGKDVYVIPNMTFDDAASTVSLQFDIEK